MPMKGKYFMEIHFDGDVIMRWEPSVTSISLKGKLESFACLIFSEI